MPIPDIRQPRRNVIVCAGLGLIAAVVAACSTSGKNSSATPTGDAPTSGAAAPGAPSGAITTTADVPVGSAVIVDDVVVTQPTAGVFKGFSSVCTHSGCNVSEVKDAKIICRCHGSEFNLDGTVAEGPATKPLESKSIAVQGNSIVSS